MRFLFLTVIFASLGLAACSNSQQEPATQAPRSTVSITTIQMGVMKQTQQLSATAAYLKNNSVTAPLGGYIFKTRVNFNDRVEKGQLLFSLESKERAALGDTTVGGKDYGIINVYAPVSGIITATSYSEPGAYVSEGTLLCTISDNASLYFQMNIPYEFKRYIGENSSCKVTLPDRTSVNTHLKSPIMQANAGLQTIPYMAVPDRNLYVPAGIIATAQFVIYRNSQATMLPKEAVLSDELMQKYWVMKLINDSTAVKVPVSIGAENDSLIEIKAPQFSKTDKILFLGNYGLGDTALVKVL